MIAGVILYINIECVLSFSATCINLIYFADFIDYFIFIDNKCLYHCLFVRKKVPLYLHFEHVYRQMKHLYGFSIIFGLD